MAADAENEPTEAQMTRLVLADEPNRFWAESEAGHQIGVRPEPLIEPGATVFTLGSCFAHEIRTALRQAGNGIGPDYESLDIDRQRQQAGPLAHINYYDTFAIRQEFERAFSDDDPWYLPIRDGAWPIVPNRWHEGPEPGPDRFEMWQAKWQDPRRHGVVAATEDDIVEVMAEVDTLTRAAIESADAFLFTLGIIENWIDVETGHYVWASRVRDVAVDPERFQLHVSDYAENHANVAWLVETLGRRFPGKPIIITVSPVGLLRTFTDTDVIVANNYGKSVLRSVAGAISNEYDHVTYWPSYEFATTSTVFEEDGRHVEQFAVDYLVEKFLAAHAPATAVPGGH